MRNNRRRAPDWIALSLLLLAAGLRFWNLAGPSFWYDEAYSWWVGTQVTPAQALASSLSELIPPGVYMLWRGWAALVGTSEFALRALSTLSGIITVAAAARAASRLEGHATSRLVPRPAAPSRLSFSPTHAGILLTAIAPPLLWASREFRMYGPLLAFIMLGNAALLEVLLGVPRHRRAWAWLWGATSLAALYTVVLSGIWLIGLGVFFLAVLALEPAPDPAAPKRESTQWAFVRALAPPALLAAALYLPWLIPAVRQMGDNRGFWAGNLPLLTFFARTFQGMTFFRTPWPEATAQRLGAAITAFAIMAPVLTMPVPASRRTLRTILDNIPTLQAIPAILRTPWLRPRRSSLPRHLLPALFTLTSLVPPLILLGLIIRTLPKWGLQHMAIFAPPLYLALATVAARLARPVHFAGVRSTAAAPGHTRPSAARVVARQALAWLLRLALLGSIGILAVAVFNLLTHPAVANDDWRGLTAYVEEHRAPGELVIIRAGSALPAWQYYQACCDDIVPLPDDPLLDVTHVLNYANTAPVLSARLLGASGAWVVSYLAEVADPTDIIGTLLEEVGTEQAMPGFRGLGLRRFVFDPAPLPETFSYPEQPSLTLRPNVELLPGLRLWGFTLPSEAVSTGEPGEPGPGLPADQLLRIRTWWTTPDPGAHVARVYQASLRIVDAAGNTWARHDAPPGGGDFRPERWPTSAPDAELSLATPILGRFDLALLPGTPGGTYTATLTLYEIGGTASPPYILGPLLIGRSATPPPVPAAFAPATHTEGSAALNLMGARLAAATVAPCEALTGALFWEVESPPRLPYRVQIRLGAERVQLIPISAGGTQDLTALRTGERFQTQFRLPISCRALDTRAPVEVGLVMPGAAPGDPFELFATWTGPEAEIVAGRVYELPTVGGSAVEGGAPVLPLETTFGMLTEDGALSPVATLVGYSVAAEHGPMGPLLPADKPFTLVLYWRAERQTDVPYTVFVHATPPDTPGPVVAQHDGWPGLGRKPTPHWVTGEVVADAHPIPALSPGTYALRTGLYGPDGKRLVTLDGDSTVVTLVTVGRQW
jgi:hypothetical protein